MAKQKGPKIIWENYRIIADVQSTDYARFQVAIAAKSGLKYVCIRQWYRARKDETQTWKPSWAGITIPVEAFSEIADANGVLNMREVAGPVLEQLHIALKELEDFDLFDEDHVVLQAEKEED